MMRQQSWMRGLWLVLSLAVGVGCAGDQEDINLVQPGYVKKSDLLGKSWYYRKTVVDGAETNSYLGVGSGSLYVIERIRFDITKNSLVAYQDYPTVDGAQLDAEDGEEASEYGAPIAIWPIESHFDIRRSYNSATAEETNVISENMERDWNEREFMRVAWSSFSFDSNALLPAMYAPVTGRDDEDAATSPFRARLTPDQGFFDFVAYHTVIPDYMTCYYTLGLSPYACGQAEVRVRHAFMEVDEQREAGYEPLDYPDSVVLHDDEGNPLIDPDTNEYVREDVFGRFGAFRNERYTYDQLRGRTESGRDLKAIRFDIWDRSIDADGNVIPYADRTVRPVEYYLNFDFPADMLETAAEVAEEWNQSFKTTVAALQGKAVSDVPDVVILRENNCTMNSVTAYLASHKAVNEAVDAELAGVDMNLETLDNFCAATEYHSQNLDDAFTWQQMGDPRFNMLIWITDRTPSGWSGYGPMLADPISGRNVVSTSYLMGWSIERSAVRAAEYIAYMNDEISVEDLIQGKNVDLGYRGDEFTPPDLEDNSQILEEGATDAAAEFIESLEARFAALELNGGQLIQPIENESHFQERLARIQGTSLEEELFREEDLLLAGRGDWMPGQPVTSELMSAASELHYRKHKRERYEEAQSLREAHTMCPVAQLDDALVGLAEELKDASWDERVLFLKRAVFKAVALHELGHNFGLRHNFSGSWDAVNYHEEFWDIEEANLTVEEKLQERQPEYMYSSIMDYHGKVNADYQGLGMYDKAFTRFVYGQLVDQFADTSIAGGDALKQFRFENDYKDVTVYTGGKDKLHDRTYTTFDWNKPKLTKTEVDSMKVNEVPYLFCSDEYARWKPTCKRFDFGGNYRELQAHRYVSYKNYFVFSNFLRNRRSLQIWQVASRGYSRFRDIVTEYQNMYLYRAKQEEYFGDTPFFSTDLGKDMAAATAQGLNMMTEVFAMPEPGRYYRCENPDNRDEKFWYPSWYISYSSLDQDDPDNPIGYGTDGEECLMLSSNSRVIGLGDTEPLFLDFTPDFTEWEFQYVGTYWDKSDALIELLDPQAFFYRENLNEDERMLSISPYRLYQGEIARLLQSVIMADKKNLASFAAVDPEDDTFRAFSLVSTDETLDRFEQPGDVLDGLEGYPVIPPLPSNMQRFGLLYGLAFLSSPMDEELDFAKYSRVVLKGSMDDVAAFGDDAANDGLDIAECRLPESGKVYRARQTRDGIDIGYDLINQCQAYVDTLESLTIEGLTEDRDARDAAEVACDDATAAGAADAEALCETYRTLRDAYRLDARAYSRASFGLVKMDQLLQYARRAHMMFEHGIGY